MLSIPSLFLLPATDKAKADDKKQADKGKKPNEKTTKPSGKPSTGENTLLITQGCTL
jgi:hypothetical protein